MNAHHHIISIGGSDSGIDEIASFFDQKPLAGVSYIVIPHLSIAFQTKLAEILARHVDLAIREAQNGILVEADHIYIIPSNSEMTILKGRLQITPKTPEQGLHRNIDRFFNSLAADQGEKAIGVILCEMDGDVLGGIRAIRDAGGIVIAREQETDYSEVSSCVDFVAEPRLMAKIIENHVMQSRRILLDQNEKVTMETILNVIRENTAFDFSGYKFDILSHKTRKRALDQHFYSLADYLSFLKVTSSEMLALSSEFLSGTTTFSNNGSSLRFFKADNAQSVSQTKKLDIDLNTAKSHKKQISDLKKELNELKTDLSAVRQQSDVSLNDLRSANAVLRLANGRMRHDNQEMRSENNKLDIENKKLIELNEELDNFVHLASHDLLAPLAHIEGSIALMSEIGVRDAQLAEVMDVIDASLKRFRALVEDIGTVAKVEHDLKSREKVDINEIIQSVLWPLEPRIKQSHTQITVDLQEKDISFSKKNLRSIVFNLISNSLKFNEGSHPAIHISTKKIDRQVILSIKDNGIGIPTPELDHIFALYGRLRHDIEGNGVGLYLTKRIIDASGGSLVVESAPGEGSNFSIYFAAD
ncbi:signal transduction histidine kinase [Dyadobacter sp. BE34]|uniref:histidine kinase n=1 Tax=Dyadobacter fermentans TaxID=94254 RepID=A0ABU1QSW1_9BACT|nr:MULTISPECIES: chemotaxis protein CheB [Dyadobacter]MDR6804237.1 signal transduction histidine kinase [Dyadobacter fermentans]MDR7041977.1 signal transduction histidine kinase [Dyadobacter sp. BE242]MDR7196380.1 signal transduction histidine kinase [Dyadobacter sp. BE34]MDR7213075.1 signal transduction histidine kinase [Dyadobacter sp. BE31]MDR7261786.1 signal transduction histidine kinase [Dyadobacter sp. BE32]